MKKTLIFVIAGLILFAFSPKENIKTTSSFEPIAVVELFTSQGCSSCPAADKLLAETKIKAKDKKVFLLSFHVDYWNRLGWKDPFSNKLFSERQAAYVTKMNLQSAYTPQIVVNGTSEFVGSNAGLLQKNIDKSLNVNSTVSFVKLSTEINKGEITIAYKLEGAYNGTKINVALVADKEVSAIKAGENEGLTAVNENVVHYFTTVNIVENGEGKLTLPYKNIEKEKFKIIAFVQSVQTNYIVGAVSQKI